MELYPETKVGLEQAKARLAVLNERDSSDTSGNPDKYTTQLREARDEVHRITESLKRQGILSYSEKELLNQRLDREFPNARSRKVVSFEGKRYQKRFMPASKSRSGKTVYRYDTWWDKLPNDK